MAGAQMNVFGPCGVFVTLSKGGGSTVGGGQSAQFLGHAKRSPVIEIIPEFKAVYGDTTGRVVPFDEIRYGEHALIRADLNRFDMAVYRSIAGQAGSAAGVIDGIGTMMHTEGYSLIVSLLFPFMKTGYRFPASVLSNPQRLDDMATVPSILSVLFHAVRQPGTKILYDNNVAGLKAA